MELTNFFDISGFEHKAIFQNIEYIWDILKNIKDYIIETLNPNVSSISDELGTLSRTYVIYKGVIIEGGFRIKLGSATKGDFSVYMNGEKLQGATVIFKGATLANKDIYIGRGTVVEPGAYIKGPTIIGNNCEIRHGAYIRGNVLVGNRCVIGHTTEVKNSCFLDQSKAGHFAYIGDSILGNRVNLGAGTKLANLNIGGIPIQIILNQKKINTGLKKFGAILGDEVEIGCNAVTNPGTMLGKGSIVYPNTMVKKGLYPPKSIIR
jgi:NDP-sugar pyrophosphorylase family protein